MGRPVGDGKPQSEAESDEEPEESYVDALTRDFSHSTTDLYIPVPASELVLAVRRNASPFTWSSAEDSQGRGVYGGLLAEERPDLAFGAGWSSNLSPRIILSEQVDQYENLVALMDKQTRKEKGLVQGQANTATVIDEHGMSYQFVIGYNNGAPRFMPMPSASNQLQNYLATLELDGGEYVFKKKFGTTLRFDNSTYDQLLSNNRRHGSKQYTKKTYSRLNNVTDRYGEQLVYTYRDEINLIPAEIYVASRPSLGIAIHQDTNGRVTSVVDPKGNTVNYGYQGASGAVISGDAEAYPADSLLASVTRGGIQTAEYKYSAAVEDDPRDTPLESENGQFYDIRAWAEVNGSYEQYSVDTCHVNLSSIKDAYGNETSISYAFDESRSSFVREARYAPIFKDGKNQLEYIGFFKGNVPVIGLPRDVSNIQTPGGRIMGVSGTHLVEATDDGIEPVARQTMVADVEGNVTTYTWGGFAVNEFQDPDLDYVYSEQVSKTHVIGYQTMTIAYDGGGTESLAFSPSAGYALQSVVDFSGNTTTYNYTDPAPAEVSNFGGSGFSVYGDPNSETKITSGGNVVRNYQYDSATRVMKEIEDALGRKTNYTIAANGLRTDEVVTNAAGVKMSEKVFAYGQNGFAAFMSSSKVKAFATNPELDDPAWVSDIVTLYEADSNGRVQRSAVDMNGNSSIDSGDLISSYTYDRNGNKLSVTDPEGNTTYFHYDALNRLVKVVNPDGSSKQMVYDYRSNKVMDIDELGLKTGYVYDAGNRLVTTVRDMNRNLSYNATSNTFSGIDTNTDLISSVTYNNLNVPVAATDTRGYITVTEYDYLVRPTKVITPKENTLPDTTPDAGSGYVSSMFYGDNAGGSAFNVSGFKPTKATDPRGYRTYAKYDDLYRPVESYKEYDKTNGYFSKSLTTYDAVGNALTVTTWRNPFQITESQDGMTFTATSVGTEQKQSVLTDYDGLNRATMVTKAYQATDSTLTSEVYSRYTSTGFVHQTEEQTDHNGQGGYFSRINDVEYDAAGRAVKAIGPEVYDATSQSTQRPVTLTEYTPNGNKAAMINPLNKRWDYVYDARNRLVQELQPAVFDYETGQTRRPTSTTEYDEVGNVVHTVNPRGHISTVYYDDAFRAVETHAPLAPIDGLGLSAIITKSEYNAAGNVTKLTDANGNVTLNTYDSLGRLAATTTNPTTKPVDGTVHADDIVVENSYDAVGNLVQVIAARDEIGDLEKDHVTGFVYDGFNRLLEKVWNADDAARKKTEYSYYDAALLTHTIDPKGQKIAYEYDEIFRLQTVEYDPDNTTTHPDNRQMSYDLAGRQKSVVYPNESSANQEIRNVSQTYDALDRVLSETSNGVTHTTAYDLAGNTLLQTYGQTGRTLTCTYDSLNRLSTCTESPSGGGTSRVTSYAYDLVGGITEKSLPSGQKEFKSFDSLGRTAWIENRKSNGDVIGRYDYGYDALGNVTVIEESYPAGNLQPRLITNLYDNVYRLRYESSEEGVKLVDTEYQYDKANNRTLKSVDTTVSGTTTTESWNYTFGTQSNGFNSNQLVSYTKPDTTVVSFTYDANGNRATRTHQANTDTYSYDLNNRLVSLDLNSSADSAKNGLYEYGYDHRTRRVLRDESDLTSGKTTRVVFSGGLSVQEHEQNAGSYNLTSPAVEYVRGSDYGGGMGGVLYTLRAGVPSYNAYNSRGDVVSKTDDSEAITWQASYEAFGTRTEEDGSTDDRQKANTKDEDPTGLLNEGMRYRDLEAGVFITRDPAGFVDGPNVYTYVRQNPWSAFDPLGLESKHWHHRFPQQYANWFLEHADMDIHDAKYGIFLDASDHRALHAGNKAEGIAKYNSNWEFFTTHVDVDNMSARQVKYAAIKYLRMLESNEGFGYKGLLSKRMRVPRGLHYMEDWHFEEGELSGKEKKKIIASVCENEKV
ncbi:RHS repeat-associated core domain-containing protein [Rubritalea squalenifaciens]|uniref:RHS repeat-associated core domain-containing protein n=1 Tax=Rubritalea squalenifaciens TaxID=407226 RepID=UPI0011602F9C|nr:RHS repeat-associated core domain-containing protein [Rubritalea squalenifaciens]